MITSCGTVPNNSIKDKPTGDVGNAQGRRLFLYCPTFTAKDISILPPYLASANAFRRAIAVILCL